MTNEEYAITLKNCAFMLKDDIKYMKEEHQKQFKEAYEKAIEALSEPTIPLSVIEKIHDAIDNAEPDSYIKHPLFYGDALTKEHVHEIIDKAVKEYTHE